jgi:hypothetical protein
MQFSHYYIDMAPTSKFNGSLDATLQSMLYDARQINHTCHIVSHSLMVAGGDIHLSVVFGYTKA